MFADESGTVYASVSQFVTKMRQEKFDSKNIGLGELIMATTDEDELDRLGDQVEFFRAERWDLGLCMGFVQRAHDLIEKDYLKDKKNMKAKAQLKLYPYQKDHVAAIKEVFTYSWFCLDQSLLGLGKTYTAAQISMGYTHLIVVAPLSVCGKWETIKQQYKLTNVHSITRSTESGLSRGDSRNMACSTGTPDTDHDFDATEDYLDLFRNKQTVLLVIDEVQNLKNSSAQMYACKALAEEIRTHKGSNMISISGSPIDKAEQAERMFYFLGFFDPEPDLYPVIETFKAKVYRTEGGDYRPSMKLFEGEFKDLFIRRMPLPDYKTKLTIENAYYTIVPKSDEAALERHVAKFGDLI